MKLCDFGSATAQCFQPDPAWSANQRALLEEEVGVRCYVAYSEILRFTSLEPFVFLSSDKMIKYTKL